MVVHRGGTIKKGRLINVTQCRVAGSDVTVARAANLHQATFKVNLNLLVGLYSKPEDRFNSLSFRFPNSLVANESHITSYVPA